MARSYVSEARLRGLGPRRERIGPIIERLAVEHGDAEIALNFGSDVELLISVMLSAQTTDVNVNRVTKKLFVKYRRPEDYLAVPIEELEQDVFQTGFYRQKAKSIRGAMTVLLEEFDGVVPRTIPELLRLPGVARKTANVVAAELGEAQGIVVDTHVRRISQRLGLTREDDPVKIERDLVKIVPKTDWHRFPHLLIWHGRRVCDARKPLCEECALAELCPAEPHTGAWLTANRSTSAGRHGHGRTQCCNRRSSPYLNCRSKAYRGVTTYGREASIAASGVPALTAIQAPSPRANRIVVRYGRVVGERRAGPLGKDDDRLPRRLDALHGGRERAPVLVDGLEQSRGIVLRRRSGVPQDRQRRDRARGRGEAPPHPRRAQRRVRRGRAHRHGQAARRPRGG